MTEARNEPLNTIKTGLPRRDWILLPLLGLLTIVFLMAFTELIARRMFSTMENIMPTCLILDDQSTGVRGRPNTTCMYKRPEHSLVEYRFNSCGHRAGIECGPKPDGTYRIVLMGSSYSMGLGVPRENSFAALLPNELSRQARRKVEIYNEGMWGGAPRRAVLNFNDVLAAKPDMILWPLTPWDIEHGSLLGNSTHVKLQDTAGKEIAFTGKVGLGALKIYRKLQDSSAAFLIRHFLYESQSQYLRSYLSGRDDQTGFLKSEPSEEWQSYLRQFDIYFADAEARASAAGVPLVVVLVPNRAMAAMISAREWPASYDPYKLGEELRTIVTRHGGIYIDILPDFRNVPNPEKYYFPVDDHPYPEGHAVISSILAKELTNGTVPSLRAATRPQAASEQGK